MTRVHAREPFQLRNTPASVTHDGTSALVLLQRKRNSSAFCPSAHAHLVRKAAVLIASLHELAPDFVEALVVRLEQAPVRLADFVPLPPQVLYNLQADSIPRAGHIKESNADHTPHPSLLEGHAPLLM